MFPKKLANSSCKDKVTLINKLVLINLSIKRFSLSAKLKGNRYTYRVGNPVKNVLSLVTRGPLFFKKKNGSPREKKQQEGTLVVFPVLMVAVLLSESSSEIKFITESADK